MRKKLQAPDGTIIEIHFVRRQAVVSERDGHSPTPGSHGHGIDAAGNRYRRHANDETLYYDDAGEEYRVVE